MERYATAMITLVLGAVLVLATFVLAGGGQLRTGAAGDEVRRQTVERLNGGGLAFVPGTPPSDVIAEGDALAAARRNLHAEAESEPVLTFGRFTDEFSRNGPPAALVADRQVWVASYARVRMWLSASSRTRSQPDTVPATADVVIDARTGAFLRSMHGGLEPVVPVPSATWDCSRFVC